MNLYQIFFGHYGPKDSEFGNVCMVLAESDEQVYNYIVSQGAVDFEQRKVDANWKDREGEVFELYDDEYEVIGTETFKERMIRLRGEANDEDYPFDDLFYGLTLYGWELLKENPTTDFDELIQLGVVVKLTS